MTEKEQLYYLINGVLDGSYQVKTFCSEFTRVYDLEVDYEQLSELVQKFLNKWTIFLFCSILPSLTVGKIKMATNPVNMGSVAVFYFVTICAIL